MNVFQQRMWDRMIRMIEDCQQAKISFHRLVDQLEETMEKADIREPEVVEEWYGLWNPLEELDEESQYDMELDRGKIQPPLQKMKRFLIEEEKTLNVAVFHQGYSRKIAHSKG